MKAITKSKIMQNFLIDISYISLLFLIVRRLQNHVGHLNKRNPCAALTSNQNTTSNHESQPTRVFNRDTQPCKNVLDNFPMCRFSARFQGHWIFLQFPKPTDFNGFRPRLIFHERCRFAFRFAPCSSARSRY